MANGSVKSGGLGQFSYVVATVLVVVIVGAISFLLYRQFLKPKSQTELQTQSVVSPNEFTDSFFTDSFLVKEESAQGLQVKAGFQLVEASPEQEAGTLVGVRIDGVIPEGSIPVVWAQYGGAWSDNLLTPIDPENPVLFGVFGIPRNVAEVTALEIRLEPAGVPVDQPQGPILWDMTNIIRSEIL